MILIGLTGPAGCGKDSVGAILATRHDFDRFSFAAPLKRAVMVATGLEDVYFENRDLKELEHPDWGVSPRHMMQTLGTEWARECVCDDFWIRRLALDSSFQSTKKGVITDVRFPNESSWVRSQGGTVWHIERNKNQSVKPHSSEAGVRFEISDKLIPNNGTLRDLTRTVRAAIEED